MFSEHGTPIAKGEMYWQKYIRFYSEDKISEAYETRRLTPKEYFLWKLKGNTKDTKGLK